MTSGEDPDKLIDLLRLKVRTEREWGGHGGHIQ